MKVLVTGSTGFIGGQLCRALAAQGHVVRAFHRPTSVLRLLEDLPVEHALGDLTRPETIEAAMQGIEVVFHAGALLGAGGDKLGRMYAVTVEGTRAVMQAALDAGVRRVVHTSSVAALGLPPHPDTYIEGAGHSLLDEAHTWNTRPDTWPYGYAKYLAELEVQKAAAQGLDAVIVNPSLVYGPGDIYRQSSSVIVYVARRRLHLLTEGGLNVAHITDVVAGHLAALERGRKGERYILSGENLTIPQMIQTVAQVVGAPAPTVMIPGGAARRLIGLARLARPFAELPVSASDLRLAGYYFYYSGQKARAELGLGQPRPAVEAFRDAYAWFQQIGALPLR